MSFSEYIIYEDENVIALNKPEGMLVIPDGYKNDVTNLRDTLTGRLGEIFVVHRIDKLTSGLVLFAKNKATHKRLNELFERRKIRKIYHALIFGIPLWTEKTISLPLRINGDRRHRTTVDLYHGKKAITDIKIIFGDRFFCGAQISPKSGYTHQIRAHLSAIGHPIIGDQLYCRLRSKDKNGGIFTPHCEFGMFLHAHSLEIIDQSIKIPILIAPLPKKFTAFKG